MSNSSEIPKNRKTHLFKMAAKIAVKQGRRYLENNPNARIKTLVDQADILVSHVGQLKGAAMKAVQTLSVEGADFLPPEVIKVLEKLQSQADPIPNEILIDLIRRELGEDRFSQLKNISRDPIAAASIGQVYEATYEGKPVVIKVQYPGVAESVDADIDTLKKLLKALLVVSQKKIELDDLMEEARRVLKLETNYKFEEESLTKYSELFKGTSYRVPRVYPEFTTRKVLVMSKEKGLEFSQWVDTKPSMEKRRKVAEQLLDLYIKEFFENQLVQTDPNPANFLVNDQAELVLLDFGATMSFPISFVKDYQSLLRSAFKKDKQELLENIFRMDFLSPKESDEVKQGFVDFLIYSLLPFEERLQPFDFSDNEYSLEVRQKAMSFSRKLKFSAPPKQLIFLHRKLGGIFMLLKKLEVNADLGPFREMILNKDF